MQILAELHCHTRYSDSLADLQGCLRAAARKDIRVLAITDHNTAEGALHCWDQPVMDEVLVIPGEEVSTDRGHLLVYFVRETIRPGTLEDVLSCVSAQGALAYMAHPYHIPLGNRWRKRPILKLEPRQLAALNGVEAENGHNRAAANRLAWDLARQHSLPAISGSDAHFVWEIGNACTQMEIDDYTLAAARQAFETGAFQACRRRFNGYPIYLLTGLLNRLAKKHYAYKKS